MNSKIFFVLIFIISKISGEDFQVEEIANTQLSSLGNGFKNKKLCLERYSLPNNVKNHVIVMDYYHKSNHFWIPPRIHRRFNPYCQKNETALNFSPQDFSQIHKFFLGDDKTYHQEQILENNLILHLDIHKMQENSNKPFHVVFNCRGLTTSGLEIFNRGFFLDSLEYQDILNEVPRLFLLGNH